MTDERSVKIHAGSYRAIRSETTYTVDSNLTIIATGGQKISSFGAVYEDSIAAPEIHDNRFNIDGRLIGYGVGIETRGDHDKINVGATGEISGDYAVEIEGNATTLINRGYIHSLLNRGVDISSGGSTFRNYGTVVAADPFVDESQTGAKVVNEATGKLLGISSGLSLGVGDSRFINHGLVRSLANAVYAGAGNDTITNDGTVWGDIDLGDGKDVLDTRRGTIHGVITGGLGDDILITDNARYKLTENAGGGADTVVSTVSYKLSANVETLILIGKGNINGTGTAANDTLIGNDGDNKLTGGGGFDTLAGGKGDDILIGGNNPSAPGDAADRFVFSTGDGHDTIIDYRTSEDVLDFTNWAGIESIDDVISHAHDDSGADAVSIKSGHDSVLITGFSKADLTDFSFHF